MATKKNLVVSLLVTPLLTLASYVVNNANECCDQIFQAGWPRAFYGGSGGFIGETENRIFWSGLAIDLLFWLSLSLLLMFIWSHLRQKIHNS